MDVVREKRNGVGCSATALPVSPTGVVAGTAAGSHRLVGLLAFGQSLLFLAGWLILQALVPAPLR